MTHPRLVAQLYSNGTGISIGNLVFFYGNEQIFFWNYNQDKQNWKGQFLTPALGRDSIVSNYSLKGGTIHGTVN
jgi:hypothetical protein